MCLHLGGREGSSVDPLKLWGGSMTIDEGDLSGVFLSLTINAWPPWAFPLPGSTCAEVTPPEIVSSKESS